MNITDGWIKLHREILENPLWENKPFSKGQAWIDLLLMANFKDKRVLTGNKAVDIPRGSFITSELKLADRWGWSRGKTRAYLNLLEGERMITKNCTRNWTTLTIVNYGFYQDLEPTNCTTKRQRTDNEKTTKKQRTDNRLDTKEERKKERKKERKNKTPPIPPYFPTCEKLDFAFAEFVDFRRRMKAPLNDLDVEKVKRRLLELSMQDGVFDKDKAIKILNQSIVNGWKGLFPLDEEKKSRASPDPKDEIERLREKYKGE